jgi:hypothetical protein
VGTLAYTRNFIKSLVICTKSFVRKIKCGCGKHVRLTHNVYGLGTLEILSLIRTLSCIDLQFMGLGTAVSLVPAVLPNVQQEFILNLNKTAHTMVGC